jgi:hypothetical protein
VLLGRVAEEAHEHRHFRMSCRRGGAFAAPHLLLVLVVDALAFRFEMANKPCGERGEVATVSRLHYLAKISRLAVARTEPSPYPALQF